MVDEEAIKVGFIELDDEVRRSLTVGRNVSIPSPLNEELPGCKDSDVLDAYAERAHACAAVLGSVPADVVAVLSPVLDRYGVAWDGFARARDVYQHKGYVLAVVLPALAFFTLFGAGLGVVGGWANGMLERANKRVVVGDVNGDGLEDVVTCSDAGYEVWLQQKDGRYRSFYEVAAEAASTERYDVNENVLSLLKEIVEEKNE